MATRATLLFAPRFFPATFYLFDRLWYCLAFPLGAHFAGRGSRRLDSSLLGNLGVLTIGAILSAAGEEIGWRGLLVPLLNRRYGFRTAVIVSGLIWAGWHYPLMLTIRYSAYGIPLWYALIVFTLCVVGFSVFLGWLRLRSNSLWPAALAHATFNLALDMADGLTTTNPMRGYLLGESGILVAGAMIVVGLVFWLRQARLTMSTPTGYVPAGNMQKVP